MLQIIAITQLTMKRLLNYQRVTEKDANAANKRQWMAMTLDNMRKADARRQAAAHIGAMVAYAGFLFRVQNKTAAYRTLYGEGLLHNGLVALMNTLNIPVNMVGIDDMVPADGGVESPMPPAQTGQAALHLVRTGTTGISD